MRVKLCRVEFFIDKIIVANLDIPLRILESTLCEERNFDSVFVSARSLKCKVKTERDGKE